MTERTSRKVASRAAKVLRDPKSSKRAKSVAGSALTQVDDQTAMKRLEKWFEGVVRDLRLALGLDHPKRRKPPLRAK